MRLGDARNGYGWVSIALHWASAAAVLALWFVGSSISVAGGAARPGKVALHVSIALLAYGLLAARIAWRLAKGHPQASARQSPLFFAIGKVVHFSLIGALAVMLISGPVMAWAGGIDLSLFGLPALPAPIAPDVGLHRAAHTVHATGATAVILGVVLHVAGALKHAAFDRDGTFDRIMIASGEGRR